MKSLVLSMLTVLALVSGAVAQDTSRQMVTGTVVSTTNDLLVVDTPSGRMTFKLDSALDRTRYNGLQAGQQIQITHHLDTNGMDYIVTDVAVATAPATPYTSPSTPPSASTGAGNTYAEGRLPGTASGLTVAAILGAVALLAGLGVKKSRTKLKAVKS